MTEPRTYTGGCHCGAVRFEVATGLDPVISCNCSICQKRGALWTFVAADAFTLLQGGDATTDYQFNKRRIHHRFCATCGIGSYAHGQAPNGTESIAINVRCLDDVDLAGLKLTPFDGRSL